MVTKYQVLENIRVARHGISQGDVLRTFERLRRQLAMDASGGEGASAGFVALSWGAMPMTDGTVSAQAVPTQSTERWQRVEYRATFHPHSGDPYLLASGVSQTVGLKCAARATSGPDRQTGLAPAATPRPADRSSS